MGRLSSAGRGRAPRQTRGFGPTGPQKRGRNPVCFTCKPSQNVLQCRKTFGPTPRGVIQRQCSAGNRARARWATGLSRTVAANLAASSVGEGRPQVSHRLQRQPCFSLTGVFSHTSFQQTWQQAAPNCSGWDGRLSNAGRGAGPRTKHGASAQPTPSTTGRRGAEPAPRLAWGRLGRNPVFGAGPRPSPRLTSTPSQPLQLGAACRQVC